MHTENENNNNKKTHFVKSHFPNYEFYLFLSSRFDNICHRITQIKKKKLKKLLNMAVKTIIIWYRLGHDECLKFQTRHSQSYQFQKDLHSLFYHKITGVKYNQNTAFGLITTNSNEKKTHTHKVNHTIHRRYLQNLQSILPHSQHFLPPFIKRKDRLIACVVVSYCIFWRKKMWWILFAKKALVIHWIELFQNWTFQ